MSRWTRPFEWTASLLVVLGVVLIATFIDLGSLGRFVGFMLGVVVLTAGVRLAIDVARIREDA